MPQWLAKRPLPERAGEAGRYYFEVVADATLEAARAANKLGLVVTAGLAVAAGVIQAALEKHVNVWYVVRAALIAVVVVGVWVFVWCLLLAPVRRERRKDEEAEAAEKAAEERLSAVFQQLTNTEYELEREREAEPVFGQATIPRRVEGRLIRLAELPPGMWLSRRTFEDCQLTGPVKLVLAGAHFEGCHFYGMGSGSFVVVDDDKIEDHMANSIMIHDSCLIGCELHNMTIIGRQDAIDALKASGMEMPGA